VNPIDIYAAGLVDGEGTITMSRHHKNDEFRRPVVSVSSTSYELLSFLKLNYGGHISKVRKSAAHHAQAWHWMASSDYALNMLVRIVPSMLESKKVARANLLLSQYKQNTPRNGKYSPAQKEVKREMENAFFSL